MSMVNLLNQPVGILLNQLAQITDSLSQLHNDLAFHKSEELQIKRRIWDQYPTESYSFRERAAAVASTDNTVMALQLEAQVKSLTEQKYFIRLLIDNASA